LICLLTLREMKMIAKWPNKVIGIIGSFSKRLKNKNSVNSAKPNPKTAVFTFSMESMN
jgi:hypothetical protein